MKISQAGVATIARFEGWVPRPYNDAAGHATIGFGHLLHRGGVTQGDRQRWGTISRARGLALLDVDVDRFESAVNRLVSVSLTQGMFDALVSFSFNVGEGALGSSTLLRKLNGRDYSGARSQFAVWVKADGRTLEGLVRRRRAEAELFGQTAAAPRLTAREARLVGELTKIRKEHGTRWDQAEKARAEEIKGWLLAQRQRIRDSAKADGWDTGARRERYHALLAAYRG